jgi:hypothetical protein
MPTDVKMFERGCTCNAWKTRTHYHYGPMELFQRPVEPNVTWHMDLVMGFPAVSSGGGYSGGGHDLNALVTIVDAFSGMFWALPVSDTISARETAELVIRRVMLEDARGIPINLVHDNDGRFLGEAFKHIMLLTGCRQTPNSGGRSTANGKIERIHRVLWSLLEGVGLDQKKWIDRLPYAIYDIRTSASDTKAKYSPITIETGMEPRSPIATSQGLLRVRSAAVRDTKDHLEELMAIRTEVALSRQLSDEYNKAHFDEKTHKWDNESELQPGKLVWLEVRDTPLATDHLMTTVKLRPRFVGPMKIVRRRRQYTFELDMGKTGHVNIFHISRLKPFHGDMSEGKSLQSEPLPGDSGPTAKDTGKVYQVERILGHRGKPGTETHMYFIKWKGYLPQKSTWEKASGVNAKLAVERYRKQLETRRAYLDGDWVLGSEDEPLERDGGLSAAATTKNDTLVCSLMAEMTPKMLDFVASEWTRRARDFH